MAGAGFAGPALAGNAACLWNAAPEAARQKVFADTDAGDIDVLQNASRVFLESVDAAVVLKSCNVPSEAAGAAGKALADYVMIEVSAHWLESHHIATRTQLSAGWDGLDAAVRQDMIDHAADPDSPSPKQMTDFLAHTNVPGLDKVFAENEDAGQRLTIYAGARALLASHEPAF